MTDTTNRIETLTPNEAWQMYVGAQSTREFIDYVFNGRTPSTEGLLRAIAVYVRDAETCEGLSLAERIALGAKLHEHAEPETCID
jgi:hypothetical protein